MDLIRGFLITLPLVVGVIVCKFLISARLVTRSKSNKRCFYFDHDESTLPIKSFAEKVVRGLDGPLLTRQLLRCVARYAEDSLASRQSGLN
jgi:hypothetical protein